MEAIRCENLTRQFRTLAAPVLAIDRLDLTIPEGSIYALVGPNGAGKTTLIKVLVNLLAPTSGRASVLGMDSRQIRGGAFTNIGYVSENQDLPEWMSVGYFLRYLRPFYPAWDDALAAELVREFTLPPDRKIKHLSRGMKMKLALASSLAYRPRLVLLDEPFSGLDPLARDEFVRGLLERAEDVTIFVSSHDLAEIESFATHIGYLDSGRLLFSEEIAALAARFREIEFSYTGLSLGVLPDHWLRVEHSPSRVRFIESRFDPERTPELIRSAFTDAGEITARPMSLREIFVALAARSKR